jgi:hypothetical protein
VLIKDLITLPERVQPGDFVMRLSSGVTDAAAAQTLREYVITPELAVNFKDALGAIEGSVETGRSQAGYLHGSFGSGKSHFMAVLFLLLRGNTAARSRPELADLVARHDGWLSGKKFLCVPFHMIGAQSMEQGIFGQYLSFVQREHPGQPLPGVFLSGPVLDNARALRSQMGDAAFFEALNARRGSGEWGDLAAGWTPESFEATCATPPDHEAHRRLVGDVVGTLLPAYRSVSGPEAFLGLDAGLAALSQHAKGLGYDALVLFLDELVLWLASYASDPTFIAREGQKLAKLVEAQDARRPVPIVSFVARQRDLRELVGQQFTGAEELAFQDVLQYWEGRFFQIKLEDRNLPAIISRRVLEPRSDDARQALDRAFAEATADPAVTNALLTRDTNLAMFRQVYPFSPALVQTLVAVSSMLQRERTAIKVLLQILVQQRGTLKVGDLVPVGDLFDTVAQGSDAFSDAMRRYFDQAKRLYETRLQPLIEERHGARFADLECGQVEEARAKAMRADDRLAKTLLLAALVPEVEALRSLTPARLAALNHGTIRTPIPGAERQAVLGRVREWASRIGEVRVGDGTDNPTLSIRLAGVDVESILERAQGEDNQSNRRRKVRELLFEQLGVADADGLFQTHDFRWRGSPRRAEIVYGNVRELTDDAIKARGDSWRVVVDFPFDPEAHHSPADDVARIDQFRQRHETSRTIVWVPSFLSQSALSDLGTLVVLDHVLAGERFESYAAHLSLIDRQTARGLLESRQAALKQRLRIILDGAYGIASVAHGTVVHELEPGQQFMPLDPALRLQRPVGANLKEALDHLLRQALDVQFPKHPDFGESADLRPTTLKKVWAEVQEALGQDNWRKVVERELRRMVRQVVHPLELCDMGEDAIVVKPTWRQHFDRYSGQAGGSLTVAKLRAWLDEPERRGLLPELQNLVILAYAAMTNRRFVLHGGPADATIDAIDDRCELVEEPLPSSGDWEEARTRAAQIFGLDLPPLRNATTVGDAAEGIRREVVALRPGVQSLAAVLPGIQQKYGVNTSQSARSRTLAGVGSLLQQVEQCHHRDVVATLAHAPISTTGSAYAACARRAADLRAALDGVNWQPIDALPNLAGPKQSQARDLLGHLTQALDLDELAVPLAAKVRSIERAAIALLIPEPPPEPPTKPSPGWKTVDSSRVENASPGEARQRFDEAIARTRDGADVRVTVSWTIQERENR